MARKHAALLLLAGCARTGLEIGELRGSAGDGGEANDGGGGEGGAPVVGCDAPTWSRALHNHSESRFVSLAVDAECGVVVAGSFEDTIDLGGGAIDGGEGATFLARYDAAGEHLWSRRLDATVWRRLALHRDGIAIVGSGAVGADLGCGPVVGNDEGAAFVALLDPLGNCAWARSLPAAIGSGPTNLATGPDGEIVVVGEFDETIDLGAGPMQSAGYGDGYVARVTAAGELSWARRFGSPSSDELRGVAVGADGAVLLGGTFFGMLETDGAVLDSGEGGAGFLIALSPAGEVVHARAIEGVGSVSLHIVSAGPEGRWLAAGNFDGSLDAGGSLEAAGDYDGFVISLAADFDVLWATSFGGTARDWVHDAVYDAGGGVLVTGAFELPEPKDGFSDGVAIRYGASGELLGTLGFGRPLNSHDAGTAIAGDRAGRVIFAGGFRGEADLGAATGPIAPSTAAPPAFDAFVARVAL